MLWYWCQEAAVPVDYANNVSLACFRWFAVPASCLLKLLIFPATQSMFTRKGACSVRCWFYQVNWCRSCFLNRQCWRQTETVKQMSYQQKVCIQVVGDSLSVHCQPLQAVLCAASTVKSARHCNVFPVVRTRFSAHWSQADGVQKVMHCLA